MTSATSYQFSKDTQVLWFGETFICFIIFYLFLATCSDLVGVAAINHAAIYAVTFGATALTVGIYRTEVRRQRRLLLGRTIVAAALSLPTVCLIAWLLPAGLSGVTAILPPWPLEALLLPALLFVAMRLVLGLALQSDLFDQRVMVLGSSSATGWIREAGRSMHGLQLMKPPSAQSGRHTAWNGISAVIVDAPTADALPAEIRDACNDHRIRLMRDSAFLEQRLKRLDIDALAPADLITVRKSPFLLEFGTRSFDIACAIALLALTLPVLLISAVAVKLEDGGPILYRQTRVGLNGRLFTVLKFRSMRIDAEAAGPVWAARRDSRVTGIGNILRRSHVDELPQILNILRGQMSMIGPRPERPHFIRELAAAIPGYEQRDQVKPGLTGWAQVNYPYGATIEDARAKLSYDLYYVKHRGMMLNLMTLFATIRVVLFAEGSR